MNNSNIKVIAINGGTEKGGDTAALLGCVLKELQAQEIQTELIELRGMAIHDCADCTECSIHKNRRCSKTEDAGSELIEKMAQADGILFGSPADETDVSPEMKALMIRAGMVARANDQMFRRKVGAAVVSMRYAGAMLTFDALNHFFLVNEMVVPGSSFWNTSVPSTTAPSEISPVSLENMKVLGRNLAWLLKIRNSGSVPDLETILAP